MEPKPIQDVAPPPPPEIVGDIPVRAPSSSAAAGQKLDSTKDGDSNFIMPPAKPKPAINKNQEKPKPTLVIILAAAAVICLVAGAYFKYFAN